MRCQKCGNEVAEGLRFCTKCGAQMEQPASGSVPGEKTGKSKKIPTGTLVASILAAALAVILILQNFFGLPLAGGKGGSTADVGYSTPERLMEEFGKSIAANDLNGAVAMFGCGLRAENYDCGAMIERVRAWMVNFPMPFASTDTIFTDANREQLRGNAASQIGSMCFSLQADEAMLTGNPLYEGDSDLDDISDGIVDASTLDELKTFRVLRIDYAMPDMQDSETHQKNLKSNCDIYGCDEIEDYGVLYEYDGETYAGSVSLMRYGDKWYISGLSSALIGTASFGFLTPADEDEYLQMTEG